MNERIILYVDGELAGETATSYGAGFDSLTAALNIGWLNLTPGYHFHGNIDEVALHRRVLSPTEVANHYYIPRGYCVTCDTPVRLMFLGDSITDGNASGAVPDTNPYQISFRKDAWESLNTAGYNVDFVGSLVDGDWYTANDPFVPPFDPDHEGHGGWTDSQIRDAVFGFLTANPADVVALHIGTNGLNPDPNQVAEILDNIDLFDEDIIVVLAKIINRRDGSPTTSTFNENIEAMALSRINDDGDKIKIVDMENGAGLVYAQYPPGDFNDNLHPYATGYAKMNVVWQSAFHDFMLTCAPAEPQIISSPVTDASTGRLYRYDVDASGSPAPTFSLNVYPGGMTIDSVTGEISWMPQSGDEGDYPVEVQAQNSEGVHLQSYNIHVATGPLCPLDMTSYWTLDEDTPGEYVDEISFANATCAGQCPLPSRRNRRGRPGVRRRHHRA